MTLEMDVRPSDAALVDCVWRGRSTGVGTLNSVASSHWHLVVSEVGGQVDVSVHGPESRARCYVPSARGRTGSAFRFRLGVMLQDVPIPNLVDGGIVLPGASHRSFWWKGGTWERPTYENAEGLVARLAREDLIGREPLVDDALQGGAGAVSLRTLQRRFYRGYRAGSSNGAADRAGQASRRTAARGCDPGGRDPRARPRRPTASDPIGAAVSRPDARGGWPLPGGTSSCHFCTRPMRPARLR